MNIEQLGRDYHNTYMTAKELKELLNSIKVQLGTTLLKLQAMHKECVDENIEDFGTFNQLLASLNLSLARTIPLLRNSQYISEFNIDHTDYKYFDSSMLDLIRKNKKNPEHYLESLKFGISYSDLKKELDQST